MPKLLALHHTLQEYGERCVREGEGMGCREVVTASTVEISMFSSLFPRPEQGPVGASSDLCLRKDSSIGLS